MILQGHKSTPTYALDWSTVKPLLASGGKNGDIVLWNLDNFIDNAKGFVTGGLGKPQMSEPRDENGGTKYSRLCKLNSQPKKSSKSKQAQVQDSPMEVSEEDQNRKSERQKDSSEDNNLFDDDDH